MGDLSAWLSGDEFHSCHVRNAPPEHDAAIDCDAGNDGKHHAKARRKGNLRINLDPCTILRNVDYKAIDDLRHVAYGETRFDAASIALNCSLIAIHHDLILFSRKS